MYERLAHVAPPPSVVKSGLIADSVPDLERILDLPRRPVVVCEKDSKTGKYPPATQALIEVETAKFSRGQRISCACRPRRVVRNQDGTLTIFRVLPEDVLPEPPIIVTLDQFTVDNRTMGDADTLRAVSAMLPGQQIDLPAADTAVGHPCIVELNAPQAWFLREAGQLGGAVGYLGVGSGKSNALLLAPLLFPDSRLAVLLIEPKQRQHYRSEYLRLREHFRVSSIVSDLEIRGGVVPGTPALHLVSYSVLSLTKNSDLLDRLQPDVLLLDEAHRACGKSAINIRCKRYVMSRIKAREEAILRGEKVRARAVRVLDASGTLESKSVNDTQMLCAYSLGTGSPLPLDPNEAEAWSYVIDPSRQPDRKSQTAKALHHAFGNGRIEAQNWADTLLLEDPEKDLRKGFQKWRSMTPGIISASASDINASLYISELKAPKMPQAVQDALARVRQDWIRPDGDELVEKIEQLACAKNVACGFYPYWAFPSHPCTCESGAEGPARCVECLKIDEWYRKRKLWNKELRSKLLRGEVQLDSPKLCADAASRAQISGPSQDLETYCDTCWRAEKLDVRWPCDRSKHQPAWRALRWFEWSEIENKVQYEERVRWIGHDLETAKDSETHPGYFLARHAAKWALENLGVVWFQSVPLGRKIAELSGLPYFNGGPGGEDRLRAEKGDRSIICSISAHGSGTNGLQYLFDEQLIIEVPPSNASTHGVEQILGRLHRRGQKKDAVSTWLLLHAYEFKDNLRKAVAQAEFNFHMTGNKQKLLCADLDVDDL